MKIIIPLLFLILFYSAGQGQSDSLHKNLQFPLEFSVGNNYFNGKNVFNTSYNPNPSFDLNAKFFLKKNYTIGFNYFRVSSTVKDNTFVGISNSHKIINRGFTTSYIHYLNKWQFEGILSGGSSIYTSLGKQNGGYFGFGAKARRLIFSNISLSLGYNICFLKYSVKAPTALEEFYNNGIIHRYTLGFGIN